MQAERGAVGAHRQRNGAARATNCPVDSGSKLSGKRENLSSLAAWSATAHSLGTSQNLVALETKRMEHYDRHKVFGASVLGLHWGESPRYIWKEWSSRRPPTRVADSEL